MALLKAQSIIHDNEDKSLVCWFNCHIFTSKIQMGQHYLIDKGSAIDKIKYRKQAGQSLTYFICEQ